MRRFLAAICLSVLLAAPGAQAYTIDTGPAIANTGVTFGGSVATAGETFVAPGPETLLTSFTLYLNGADVSTAFLDLRGYIGSWDGSKVTTVLYASATQTVNITTNQALIFNPNILLTPGNTYVAFLSVSELPAQTGGATMVMPSASNGGGFAGGFVAAFNGTNFSQLTSQAWNCNGCFYDALFQATLENAAPEPGSLALLGAGLASLAAIRRRRAG